MEALRAALCHPDAVVLSPTRRFVCTVCGGREVTRDIHDYLRKDPFQDHFMSSRVAQIYYEATGDRDVPVTFVVADVEGIQPKRGIVQPLHRLRECVDLLRAVNAPFTTDPSPLVTPEMSTFLQRYLSVVTEGHRDAAETVEQRMLYHLVGGMNQILSSKEFESPFELYFNKLTPYVQRCVERWQPLESLPRDDNLAKELYLQLQRSSALRNVFGKFSASFDLLHVILGCYACSTDEDTVANWVLDFIARICKGRYFQTGAFDRTVRRFLDTRLTYKTHIELYRVARIIERGETCDNLSTFWPHYLALQQWVGRNFHAVPPELTDVVIDQTVPKVLFRENDDYLGFLVAQAQIVVASSRKTGAVTKGGFKTARKVYDVVRRAVRSIREFDETTPMVWTMDTLRLFLLWRPDLEKEILSVTELLFAGE